ncbi:MAG: RNA polymerase Rpb4 family protein [Candidatus Micrarchaeota archaeon]
MNIKSSKPVPVSLSKEIMAKRSEEGELGYEQSQTLDNTARFAVFDSKKAQKLIEALAGSGKISEELAVKIVDVHPDNAATLKAILVKDRVELSEEELNNILKELA